MYLKLMCFSIIYLAPAYGPPPPPPAYHPAAPAYAAPAPYAAPKRMYMQLFCTFFNEN